MGDKGPKIFQKKKKSHSKEQQSEWAHTFQEKQWTLEQFSRFQNSERKWYSNFNSMPSQTGHEGRLEIILDIQKLKK